MTRNSPQDNSNYTPHHTPNHSQSHNRTSSRLNHSTSHIFNRLNIFRRAESSTHSFDSPDLAVSRSSQFTHSFDHSSPDNRVFRNPLSRDRFEANINARPNSDGFQRPNFEDHSRHGGRRANGDDQSQSDVDSTSFWPQRVPHLDPESKAFQVFMEAGCPRGLREGLERGVKRVEDSGSNVGFVMVWNLHIGVLQRRAYVIYYSSECEEIVGLAPNLKHVDF
ncbi:MAG: hypothetical protein Q9159_005092 [Coniocarpon cinnabarinum]